MKKVLVFTFAILIAGFSCNKEPDRLSFSVKNLTTLMEKSNGCIEKTSPGTPLFSNDEYISFRLENEIEGIDGATLYYGLKDAASYYIDVLPDRKNEISDAEKLIALAENEFNRGSYFIYYYDGSSLLQKKDFFTLSEMSSYISAESMAAEDIKVIAGVFSYGKYSVFAGGSNSGGKSVSGFTPILEITVIKFVTQSHQAD